MIFRHAPIYTLKSLSANRLRDRLSQTDRQTDKYHQYTLHLILKNEPVNSVAMKTHSNAGKFVLRNIFTYQQPQVHNLREKVLYSIIIIFYINQYKIFINKDQENLMYENKQHGMFRAKKMKVILKFFYPVFVFISIKA